MSRPRVDFVAPPFRGHLHPILGLARAASGVAEVRVLTTDDRLDEVRAAGLAGVGLMSGRGSEIDAVVSPPHPVRSHPWRLWRQFVRTVQLLEEMTHEVERHWARDRPNLVVADSVLPSIGALAGRLGVAWWTSLASPCTMEPRRGTPGYLGGWRHYDHPLGRWRDRAGLALIRAFKRGVFALQRGSIKRLGFDQVYRSNGDEAIYSPACVLGLSMTELELPRVWPPAFRMVGPVLSTPSRGGLPEPRLEHRRRHVLVTLGTHLPWAKAAVAERFRRAATGQDRWVVHFSAGQPELGAARTDEGLFRMYSYIDYAKHLPEFDLIVHHGGAGVMFHCLRAGKPALLCPMDYDQFDHAVRLERVGAARRLRARDDARRAVDEALDDPGLRAGAARMRDALGRYDAPATVASMIAEWCRPQERPRNDPDRNGVSAPRSALPRRISSM